MRNKYRFGSRADAEREWEFQEQRAHRAECVINSLLSGGDHATFRHGRYTARVFPRPTSGCHIVTLTFRCEGQTDYTATYDGPMWARDEAFRTFDAHADADCVAVRALAHDVLEHMNRLDRPVEAVAS